MKKELKILICTHKILMIFLVAFSIFILMVDIFLKKGSMNFPFFIFFVAILIGISYGFSSQIKLLIGFGATRKNIFNAVQVFGLANLICLTAIPFAYKIWYIVNFDKKGISQLLFTILTATVIIEIMLYIVALLNQKDVNKKLIAIFLIILLLFISFNYALSMKPNLYQIIFGDFAIVAICIIIAIAVVFFNLSKRKFVTMVFV